MRKFEDKKELVAEKERLAIENSNLKAELQAIKSKDYERSVHKEATLALDGDPDRDQDPSNFSLSEVMDLQLEELDEGTSQVHENDGEQSHYVEVLNVPGVDNISLDIGNGSVSQIENIVTEICSMDSNVFIM